MCSGRSLSMFGRRIVRERVGDRGLSGRRAPRTSATPRTQPSCRARRRLHGPDDAQAELREVDVGRRAIASVEHLTTGSPRTRSSAPANADDSYREEAVVCAASARRPLYRPGGRERPAASLIARRPEGEGCACRLPPPVVAQLRGWGSLVQILRRFGHGARTRATGDRGPRQFS